MDKSILYQVSEIGVAMNLDAVPAEAAERAKVMIADALEGCLVGSRIEARVGSLQNAVRPDMSGAVLYGDRRLVNYEDAILYNIVSGTASARNDTHLGGRIHPGCCLVPAILAAAQIHHISGKRAVEAILFGTECMIRFGATLRKGTTYPLSDAIRFTSLPVPVGTAFAMAKLFGDDVDTMANAAALALCHINSIGNQWRFEGTGEDAYENAWSVLSGVMAERLARGGIRGGHSNLDGKFGFLAMFGAEKEAHHMLDGLGQTFEIMSLVSKPVAACILTILPCQLSQELLDDKLFKLDNLDHLVADIIPETYAEAWSHNRNINDQSSAIHSVPYCIANVLAEGSIADVRWYAPYNEKTFSLMDRISLECDEYAKNVLNPWGCKLSAYMKDGSVIVKEAPDLKPFSAADIHERFRYTASRLCGDSVSQQASDMLQNFESVDDVSAFAKLFI